MTDRITWTSLLVVATSCGTAGTDIPEYTPVPVPYCAVDETAIDALYDSMSLRKRVGQHLMVGVQSDGKSGIAAGSRQRIEDYALGGVFVQPASGIVIGDPLATATFVHAVKKLGFETTGVPIFVALDQEGGPNATVNSLMGGTDTIGSMPIGATRDPLVAFEEFDIMGREVRELGMNMDLGPVVDTLYSTQNGNHNTRSFGPDPDLNAVLGVAAVNGLQTNLVLAVSKHFPGDGLTGGNTHVEHVVVDHGHDFLESTILKPFRAVVAGGTDGIMTIPALYPALDPVRSAVTSRAITTDLLRHDMGFEGLVVTDALGMEGIAIGLEPGQSRGMEALKAGADILLYVVTTLGEEEEVFQAVQDAMEDGTYPESEFEASTKRILRMKQRYCLFEAPDYPGPEELATLTERIGLKKDRDLSRSHADRAVVLLHDDGVLPLTGSRVLYLGPGTVFQDPGSHWINVADQTFGDALAQHGSDVKQLVYMLPVDSNDQYALALEEAETADVVVLGTLQGRFDLGQQQLLEWMLTGLDKPLVHVILGVPFDYVQSRGRAAAALALMGWRSTMVEAGAAVLYGKQTAVGTMLFDLGTLAGQTGYSGPKAPSETPDRCTEQSVTCSGSGLCVDFGEDFGCICHPNWHSSSDGLDCLPDGSEG